jgi:hypothetical protein
MRWIARLLALVATGLFVLFLVDFGSEVIPALGWSPQGIPLLIGLVVGLVGLLIAWRWELVGGVMAVAGAVVTMALVCLGSGTDMLYCAFLFTAPILIAGALYLACCWRKRHQGVAA